MDSFLTVKDICSLLKVERDTVIRWIMSGKLRAFKPGGGRFWRIGRPDLHRFLRSGADFRGKSIK